MRALLCFALLSPRRRAYGLPPLRRALTRLLAAASLTRGDPSRVGTSRPQATQARIHSLANLIPNP